MKTAIEPGSLSVLCRSLLAYDVGITVDRDWRLTGLILAEAHCGMFSTPLRNWLTTEEKSLYQAFLEEVRKKMDNDRHFFEHHKNLGAGFATSEETTHADQFDQIADREKGVLPKRGSISARMPPDVGTDPPS